MKTTLEVLLPAVAFLAGCSVDGTNTPEDTATSEGNLSSTSTVDDATGDSTHSAAYMDVVSGKVALKHGNLEFSMELAGAIPEHPAEGFLIWPWHVDRFPASPGGLYVDYAPRVIWTGSAFVGQVLARFTNLDGTVGTSITSGIPFEMNGGKLTLTVNPAILSNPSTFGWNASTRPNGNVPYSDFAGPDGSCPLATAGPAGANCLAIWSAK